MPSEDSCEHGLIRTQCSICQAPPEYKMKESLYKGSPIVELLYRDGPIHERGEHFKFRKSEAKLFLAYIDIVEELHKVTKDPAYVALRRQLARWANYPLADR